jgi:tyrosyl-tRNA synthetase
VKYGMDPTAPDIHLGNAIALHKLRVFQEMGHRPVIIIGDYTAMVGDPSGANRTRPMLSRADVEANAKTYLEQVGRIVDLEHAEVRRNGEWFEPLRFSDLIALCSSVTVARLTERDDFAKRLGEGTPIGVHELLYPIMQAYDSVMVKADVEIGGTDQKFNLLLGRELQRAHGQVPQVVMTHPMLEGLDGGRKMSKSLGNYIGIEDPPDTMFGRAMSISDSLMGRYLLWTTDLPDAEIERLLDPERTHPRDAKEELARAIVTRYHGEAAARAAAEEFRRVFSKGEEPGEMPEILLSPEDLEEGRIWVVGLVLKAGFAASGSEARRLVGQGAVGIDGDRVTDVNATVALRGGETLRVGKRRFGRIRIG